MLGHAQLAYLKNLTSVAITWYGMCFSLNFQQVVEPKKDGVQSWSDHCSMKP